MRRDQVLTHFSDHLAQLRREGTHKTERAMVGKQAAHVLLEGEERTLINLCSNNYLGLSNDPTVLAAGHRSLEVRGYGLASVRFICGTQDVHKELEARLSQFLGMEDTILYSSCFDANAGLFEALLGESDAVISDELNHASIIDGVRLCKARRYRYRNNDMEDLERQLRACEGARIKMIATDGVFSMDGIVADLPSICDLADKYGALTMVDDSHAVGFFGRSGGGTPDHFGVRGRVDLVTGTLGKALGGASGGYTAGRKPLIDWLRQRSRPYLFSNSVSPVIVSTSLAVLDLLGDGNERQERLWANTDYFRSKLQTVGFRLTGAGSPIIPVLLGDANIANQMADLLHQRGVLVTAFSYPVVPHGLARIRTQASAAHSTCDLDVAAAAFQEAGMQLGVL